MQRLVDRPVDRDRRPLLNEPRAPLEVGRHAYAAHDDDGLNATGREIGEVWRGSFELDDEVSLRERLCGSRRGSPSTQDPRPVVDHDLVGDDVRTPEI